MFYSHILMQAKNVNTIESITQLVMLFCDVYIYCMGKLLTNCHTVVDICPLCTEILRVREKHFATYIKIHKLLFKKHFK